MRDYGIDVEAHLASLSGLHVRHLVWIEAKNRETGLPEPTGFWDGLDVREFVIGGEARTYAGSGTLMSVGVIKGKTGMEVRMHQLGLSRIPPEISQLIRGYDARLAPIEVHKVLFDPVKGTRIGNEIRVLKGWVDEMPVPTAAEGGTENVTLTVASASRALTRRLTVKKSDAAQRRIDPNDRGREYATTSGAVGVFWGVRNKRGSPPGTSS